MVLSNEVQSTILMFFLNILERSSGSTLTTLLGGALTAAVANIAGLPSDGRQRRGGGGRGGGTVWEAPSVCQVSRPLVSPQSDSELASRRRWSILTQLMAPPESGYCDSADTPAESADRARVQERTRSAKPLTTGTRRYIQMLSTFLITSITFKKCVYLSNLS